MGGPSPVKIIYGRVCNTLRMAEVSCRIRLIGPLSTTMPDAQLLMGLDVESARQACTDAQKRMMQKVLALEDGVSGLQCANEWECLVRRTGARLSICVHLESFGCLLPKSSASGIRALSSYPSLTASCPRSGLHSYGDAIGSPVNDSRYQGNSRREESNTTAKAWLQ